MSTDHFTYLSLHSSLLRAISEDGYLEPTPIQKAAIPLVLSGKDLMATAQTGTGKTAAFALPMLHLLHARKDRNTPRLRALILTPTRELALQVEESFRRYGRYLRLRTTAIIGGAPSEPQIRALRKKPDVLVATPGRLLDLFGQGYIRLDEVEMLVLDEADRMLDMGFIPDVYRILSELPTDRQTMLFSATIPMEIAELAAQMLREPVSVDVAPPASLADNIEQRVLFVEQGNKHNVITGLLKRENIGRALIFTRTKRRADRLSEQLSSEGIPADAIHSSKTQGARQRALEAFDRGRIKVLVGTDIVARGIDVDGISHVINYDLPDDPESYVHRVGRTARAGAAGVALSLCYPNEVAVIRDIERLTRSTLAADENHPYHSPAAAAAREQGAVQSVSGVLCGKPVSCGKPVNADSVKPESRFGRRPVHRKAR
ncbi:MAG: DEAD/DEAH box helicase [Candidatus Latescibacterota bacterium]